jgi:hypothetical protein
MVLSAAAWPPGTMPMTSLKTAGDAGPRSTRLAEGDAVGLSAWVGEGDLEGAFGDGAGLADELVHPLLREGAVAVAVGVGPVGLTWWLPVDRVPCSSGESSGGGGSPRSNALVMPAGAVPVSLDIGAASFLDSWHGDGRDGPAGSGLASQRPPALPPQRHSWYRLTLADRGRCVAPVTALALPGPRPGMRYRGQGCVSLAGQHRCRCRYGKLPASRLLAR